MSAVGKLTDILIVDDEEAIRRSLRKALAYEDVTIQEARSGEEALQLLSQTTFSLVLTDIRMGQVDGLDLLAEIRERWPDTVVVLLTGYASVESAVQALRRGAHDYLIKPVSIEDVRASIRRGLAKHKNARHRQQVLTALKVGILELSEGGEAPGSPPAEEAEPRWLRVGDLAVDRAQHAVTLAGAPVPLTPTEYQVLVCLLEQRGRAVRYQELVKRVYGYTCSPHEAKLLIMPHVSNLRQKLHPELDSPDRIENVRGVGYILHE